MPLKEIAKKFQASNPQKSIKFSEETINLLKKRRNLNPPATGCKKIEPTDVSKTIYKKQQEIFANEQQKPSKKLSNKAKDSKW